MCGCVTLLQCAPFSTGLRCFLGFFGPPAGSCRPRRPTQAQPLEAQVNCRLLHNIWGPSSKRMGPAIWEQAGRCGGWGCNRGAKPASSASKLRHPRAQTGDEGRFPALASGSTGRECKPPCNTDIEEREKRQERKLDGAQKHHRTRSVLIPQRRPLSRQRYKPRCSTTTRGTTGRASPLPLRLRQTRLPSFTQRRARSETVWRGWTGRPEGRTGGFAVPKRPRPRDYPGN